MCTSRDIPDDLRHIEHEHAQSSGSQSREPSPMGTPIPVQRDTTFDYEQEHRLKSVSLPAIIAHRLAGHVLMLASLSTFQADSHFFAHQIRTSPSTPLTQSQTLRPAPPFSTRSSQDDRTDALDLEEELAEKAQGIALAAKTLKEDEDAMEELEPAPAEAATDGAAEEDPKHQRGHSMHEGSVDHPVSFSETRDTC
jgi:hypothetical protein